VSSRSCPVEVLNIEDRDTIQNFTKTMSTRRLSEVRLRTGAEAAVADDDVDEDVDLDD